MRHTRRVARRMTSAALGLLALASLVLPGPASAIRTEATPSTAIGFERRVADPGPPVPIAVAPDTTSVAHGGSVSVAVWQDGSASTIWLSRFSTTGARLDRIPVQLGYGSNPVVSFDGSNFLVVWQTSSNVVAKRVSPEGIALDPSDIIVSPTALNGRLAVAFDGDRHLVVWTAHDLYGLQGDILGRHVTPAGTVVEPADLAITTVSERQSNVTLAFNGDRFLLAWQQGPQGSGRVRATLVDGAGTPAEPEGVPVSNTADPQSEPAVTAMGDGFFVAWAELRAGAADLYGTRVDGSGTVTDPDGIRITTAAGAEATPAVASDGDSVLVAWSPERFSGAAARFTLVDPSGTVLDPAGRVLPWTGAATGLAFDGDGWFAAGAEATRLSPTGAVLDPNGLLLGTLGNAQRNVDASFDGIDTFVVWEDLRYPGERIYGGRVGPDGERLDGAGIALSTDAGAGAFRQDRAPAVAFDGTNHLVVWTEWSANGTLLRGARISRGGGLLGRFTIATGTGGLREPAVAFGGGTFLVTWVADLPQAQSEVRAARISPAGAVLDPAGVQLRAPAPGERVASPAVAAGDDEFLVAWSERRGQDASADLYGARVSVDGTVAGPGGAPISTAPNGQQFPDVAWLDGTYLVVWQDERNLAPGNGAFDVYGARLDASGALLDPDGLRLAGRPTDEQAPSVAANGHFLVTWTDRREEFSSGVYGTRVDPDGSVRDPDGIAISPSPSGAGEAVVTPRSDDGTFAVTYQRHVAESPYGTVRALVRNIAPK